MLVGSDVKYFRWAIQQMKLLVGTASQSIITYATLSPLTYQSTSIASEVSHIDNTALHLRQVQMSCRPLGGICNLDLVLL